MADLFREVKHNFNTVDEVKAVCNARQRVPAIVKGSFADINGYFRDNEMLSKDTYIDVICDYVAVSNNYKKKLVSTNGSLFDDFALLVTKY